jgi:asparagine N-glycosylation enzyme membrane subunit Stt3
MQKQRTESSHLFLWVILGIAILLRVVGLDHGFPYILHPDEPAVVRAALGIRFDVNPGHFDWPHLFIYLNYFAFMAFAKVRDLLVSMGLRESVSAILPLVWNDDLVFYWISRLFAAILGALTVIPVYLAGKNLFGTKAGLFAALALAIAPFHVYHSHFALIDVPMTFFLAWALFFSSQILTDGRFDDYVLAGLFTGFAASTKYNGALIALTVPLAHFFQRFDLGIKKMFRDGTVQNVLIAGFVSIFGFIIGTPFALFDYETFIRTDGPKGALWQFTNVGQTDLQEHFKQFVDAFLFKLSDDFGYTFLIAYALVFFYFLYLLFKRKIRSDEYKIWFLLIPSILFFWYVSGTEKNRSHYYMITYPFVALLAGYFISELTDGIKEFKNAAVSLKVAAVLLKVATVLLKAAAVLFFLIPLYFAMIRVQDLTAPPVVTPETAVYGGDLRLIPRPLEGAVDTSDSFEGGSRIDLDRP